MNSLYEENIVPLPINNERVIAPHINPEIIACKIKIAQTPFSSSIH